MKQREQRWHMSLEHLFKRTITFLVDKSSVFYNMVDFLVDNFQKVAYNSSIYRGGNARV